jgi:hypothetical protein
MHSAGLGFLGGGVILRESDLYHSLGDRLGLVDAVIRVHAQPVLDPAAPPHPVAARG